MFDIAGNDALEIVARVAIVYSALLIMLRLAGRRTLGDITPMDMLLMLLVSETVSPAMTGGDESVTGGMVAAGTLIVLAFVMSHAVFRSRRIEQLVTGAVSVVIKDGKVDGDVMRKYRITDEDLKTALHQNGVLRVDVVARAFVEADGEITIVKQKDLEDDAA